MAKNHNELVKKLMKRVEALQKKEEQGRKRLQAALSTIEKHGRNYRSQLAKKTRQLQDKIEDVRSSAYAKAAKDLEYRFLKSVSLKANELASAIHKIEKKHAQKLRKIIAIKKSSMKKPKRRD